MGCGFWDYVRRLTCCQDSPCWLEEVAMLGKPMWPGAGGDPQPEASKEASLSVLQHKGSSKPVGGFSPRASIGHLLDTVIAALRVSKQRTQ